MTRVTFKIQFTQYVQTVYLVGVLRTQGYTSVPQYVCTGYTGTFLRITPYLDTLGRDMYRGYIPVIPPHVGACSFYDTRVIEYFLLHRVCGMCTITFLLCVTVGLYTYSTFPGQSQCSLCRYTPKSTKYYIMFTLCLPVRSKRVNTIIRQMQCSPVLR